MLDEHKIEIGCNVRGDIDRITKKRWEKILHPKLKFLAPMMVKLSGFLFSEWTLWMDPKDKNPLKADVLHEALKWMLLKEIMDINRKKNENVALYVKLQHIPDKTKDFEVRKRQTTQPVTLPEDGVEVQPVALPEDRDEDDQVEEMLGLENKDDEVEEMDEPESEDEVEGMV